MKKLFLIIGILIINLIVIGGSCQPSAKPNDPTENTRIANEVGKYLINCPSFFMPALTGTNNGTLQNQTGAVAWTPNGITGNPGMVETRDRYIERLNLATIENQNSWYEYQEIANSGYPGYDNSHPNPVYQTGFVCYSLVYNAYKDAGHSNIWNDFPIDTDDLVSVLTEYSAEEARVGDIVVFNWDNSSANGTWWDHAGVIVNIDDANPRNWLIVSSIGLIEIFNWGAKKTRLGVFGTTNGGEFTDWPPELENWSYKIYGKNFN